MAELISQIPV